MEDNYPNEGVKPVIGAKKPAIEDKPKEKKPLVTVIKNFYASNYKKLLIIPVLILILAIIQIAVQTATTGDFIRKDVSLKGGLTVTVLTDKDANPDLLQADIMSDFPGSDISVRLLKSLTTTSGITISADLASEKSDQLLASIEKNLDIKLTKDNYTVETMGSSLGASFFKETFKTIYIAFLFMAMVVFLFFGTSFKYKIVSVILTLTSAYCLLINKSFATDVVAYILGPVLMIIYAINSIPSITVILCAFSDITVTLAVVNLIGMRISTAGIAAFLMLIGYSVDTDILLTTRLLKRKEGTSMDKTFGAFKTGIMMTLTTFLAVGIALIFTGSDTIAQIMTIVLIGLVADIIYTWLQNAAILLMYLEKKRK